MKKSIWIGYEPRETDAYMVARHTIRRHLSEPIPITPIILGEMEERNLYRRDFQRVNGRMYDSISQAPMSTEFAISRFLTPILAQGGLALFMDCDMLIRADLNELFALSDPGKALMCVKHDHNPMQSVKMDSQPQLVYPRKNWSSVMLFNCDHPANRRLNVDLINSVPGRDLHRLCWLKDDEIGELGPEWNYLVLSPAEQKATVENPKIVHFTLGVPRMPGYKHCEYAEEWTSALWETLREEQPQLASA